MAEHDSNTLDASTSSHALAFPKPPTPPVIVGDDAQAAIPSASPIADPPPPYPARERRSRAGTTRSARRALQLSADGSISTSSSHIQVHSLDPSGLYDNLSPQSPLSPGEDGGTETTPLLSPRRRQRTLSHSTVVSTHSMAHTVLSLFQDDTDVELGAVSRVEAQEATTSSALSRRSIRRYFRPLWKGAYYWPLLHLLFINFPYALFAFVYCFVGTLTGTTLLIALPIGAVICWFNIIGARAFARGEIALQTYFHGPLAIQVPVVPYPILVQPSSTPLVTVAGQSTAQRQPSFLRDTYAMFTDQTSYQAIFYFVVIKPSITLFLTIALYAMVPVAFVLIYPAPAALRAIKRIGVWQANIALEGLLQPRL